MEEECDIDVESAEDVPDIGVEATASTYDEGFHDSEDGMPKNDKREHHNLLERKRRDHIKESFYGLRDCIPQLKGEKVSRAHILNKATDYIRTMQKCGSFREGEIVGLRLKNEILEEQIEALEEAKKQGKTDNAEEILEAAQEKVEAKHKEDQLKQTKKINSLVSEKHDGDGRTVGVVSGGPKVVVRTAVNKKTMAAASAGSAKGPDPGALPHNSPAISLLASNLKNTQTLLTALQKSLPPNANLPANIKSLAQKMLASSSSLGKSQTQVTASNSLRGIVTATTVTAANSKGGTTPTTTVFPAQNVSEAATNTKTTTGNKAALKTNTQASTKTAKVKVEPVTEGEPPPPKTYSQAVSGRSPEDTKSATLVSALTTPVSTQPPSNLTPQQILRTAHLLLQQQGSALNSSIASPDKQTSGGGVSQEMIAQVSSYLNLPTSLTSEYSATSTQAGRSSTTGVEDASSTPHSFLTAALTSGMSPSGSMSTQNPLVSLALATEALSSALTEEVKTDISEDLHTQTEERKSVKRPASSDEEDTELTTKKPRVVL